MHTTRRRHTAASCRLRPASKWDPCPTASTRSPRLKLPRHRTVNSACGLDIPPPSTERVFRVLSYRLPPQDIPHRVSRTLDDLDDGDPSLDTFVLGGAIALPRTFNIRDMAARKAAWSALVARQVSRATGNQRTRMHAAALHQAATTTQHRSSGVKPSQARDTDGCRRRLLAHPPDSAALVANDSVSF
jgi:hypothetical protein